MTVEFQRAFWKRADSHPSGLCHTDMQGKFSSSEEWNRIRKPWQMIQNRVEVPNIISSVIQAQPADCFRNHSLFSYQQPKDIHIPPVPPPFPCGCHNIRKLIFNVIYLLDLKNHSEISLVSVNHPKSRETALRCCGHLVSDQTAIQSFDLV